MTKKELREKVNKAASSGARPSTKDLDKISKKERERTEQLNKRIDGSKIKVPTGASLTKRDFFEGMALLAVISKSPAIGHAASADGMDVVRHHIRTAKAYAKEILGEEEE